MKLSREEKATRRFFYLNIIVSISLLIIIVGSIFQFGKEAVEGRRVVGMVLPGNIEDNGWNKSQYDGLSRACNAFGYDLFAMENVAPDQTDLEATADTLSKRRAKMVFFLNTENLDDIAAISPFHKNIALYGIETEKYDANINKFSVRYVEAYYLAGIIAGMKTTTNKVGFVAPHSSFSINQIINAFTKGVQRIKGEAQVYLSWTGAFNASGAEEQAVRDMRANNVDIIAYFTEGTTVADAAARARIDFISVFFTNTSIHNIATISVNWENIYREIFRREKQGRKEQYTASIVDRNVNVIINQPLDARSLAIFEAETFEIREGRSVFTGPITDNKGFLWANANEVISSHNLDKMGYLLEGVKTLGR